MDSSPEPDSHPHKSPHPETSTCVALRIGPDTHTSYAEAILIGLGEAAAPVDPELVFQAVHHIASLNNEANDRWLGYGLRQHLKADVPDDLIRILVDRAVNSADPQDTRAAEEEENDNRDPLLERGINTARGDAVQALGDLLVYDGDGHRTNLVLPELNRLSADQSLAARACVAHLLAACLRHARPRAIEAFHLLIQADDRLLASHHVESLIIYIGNSDMEFVEPVIRRMVLSTNKGARRSGGRLAAYFGLERAAEELLATACSSLDSAVRQGVAEVCAGRLSHTADVVSAGNAIRQLVSDPDEKVQEAVAGFAANLRDRALQPFRQEIEALIASPAFHYGLSQLLITLEHAPDRVDDLILSCARRFVDVYGSVANDISTAAAGEAREVGELLLRAYAQAADTTARRPVLDLLDSLLATDAYGISELLDGTDR